MNKLQHGNKLNRSTPDDMALALAVEERFLDLCGAYLRIRGVELVPPVEIDGAVLRWRQMRVRHRQGDFRNTEDEARAVKEVATWLLQTNAALRNQKPVEVIWKD